MGRQWGAGLPARNVCTVPTVSNSQPAKALWKLRAVSPRGPGGGGEGWKGGITLTAVHKTLGVQHREHCDEWTPYLKPLRIAYPTSNLSLFTPQYHDRPGRSVLSVIYVKSGWDLFAGLNDGVEQHSILCMVCSAPRQGVRPTDNTPVGRPLGRPGWGSFPIVRCVLASVARRAPPGTKTPTCSSLFFHSLYPIRSGIVSELGIGFDVICLLHCRPRAR